MTILVRSNYILIDSYFGRQKRGYGLWPLTSILVVLQLAGTGHRINELLLAVRANVLRITRSFIKVTLHVCICIIVWWIYSLFLGHDVFHCFFFATMNTELYKFGFARY